jgi:hypothetical protein
MRSTATISNTIRIGCSLLAEPLTLRMRLSKGSW